MNAPTNTLLRSTYAASAPLEGELLSHWEGFIQEKIEIARNNKGPKRIQNAAQIMRSYLTRRQAIIRFSSIAQAFFNDFVMYAVQEHQHYKTRKKGVIPKGMTPTIGLSNDTAIKVIKDFRDYLQYCCIVKDVSINLAKIDRYIKMAKKKYSATARRKLRSSYYICR